MVRWNTARTDNHRMQVMCKKVPRRPSCVCVSISVAPTLDFVCECKCFNLCTRIHHDTTRIYTWCNSYIQYMHRYIRCNGKLYFQIWIVQSNNHTHTRMWKPREYMFLSFQKIYHKRTKYVSAYSNTWRICVKVPKNSIIK